MVRGMVRGKESSESPRSGDGAILTVPPGPNESEPGGVGMQPAGDMGRVWMLKPGSDTVEDMGMRELSMMQESNWECSDSSGERGNVHEACR